MIQEQGSFAVGGSVTTAPGTFDPIRQGAYNPAGTDPAGQTLHGDHAYVFYQVPVNARNFPLVFWHGHGESGKTWETTPDGREGFQNIFLRRRFPVYLIDQPQRGRASRGTQPITITASPDEQLWFGIFRLGAWPDFYEGVQFARPGGAQPVLPADGPQHRSGRRAGEYGCCFGAIRQDCAGHSGHPLAERPAGLAHGHQEQKYPGRRLLRVGLRLSFPRGGRRHRP